MEPRGQIKQTGQPCDEVSFEDLAKRTKGLVIVLMPTYNGHPAKNAAALCKALAGAAPGSLRHLQFAVLASAARDTTTRSFGSSDGFEIVSWVL